MSNGYGWEGLMRDMCDAAWCAPCTRAPLRCILRSAITNEHLPYLYLTVVRWTSRLAMIAHRRANVTRHADDTWSHCLTRCCCCCCCCCHDDVCRINNSASVCDEASSATLLTTVDWDACVTLWGRRYCLISDVSGHLLVEVIWKIQNSATVFLRVSFPQPNK